MDHSLNVGIVDFEIYYPHLFIDQTDLELVDNCKGKYVKGLGQIEMGVCSQIEDPVSLALTVVHRLMSRSQISYQDIGRVDVGTESSIDFSKSIKTFLCSLFSENGNYDIEGADNINACYGGTAALLNCLNWLTCPFWDGRLAMVVTTDISNYKPEDSGARATSGAAAVCLLLGYDPILTIEPNRAHHTRNVYDFYKPTQLKFPLFDSHLSIGVYIISLLMCAKGYLKKLRSKNPNFSLFDPDHLFAFHCPYAGLVKKASMYLHHFQDELLSDSFETTLQKVYSFLTDISLHEERVNFERNVINQKSREFGNFMEASLRFSTRIGNSFCSSVYVCLASLFLNENPKSLLKKRIILFSYGSGSLSTMFSFKFSDFCVTNLEKLCQRMLDKEKELANRIRTSPHYFLEASRQRTSKNIEINTDITNIHNLIASNTFYLTSINEEYQRKYSLFKDEKGIL